MRRPLSFVLVGAAAAAGFLAVFGGCEDAPDTQGISTYFEQNPYQQEPREDPATPGLSISPVSASEIVSGQQLAFTASGGDGPFNWSVAVPANGSVAEQAFDRQAIYTHLGTTNDANNVIVRDGDGRVAIANINL